ncbi:vacuole protein [Allomyces macrogynus ATCC 38327]|uniref:Vacuole protein n=1 Tax=Allomyces macrogynus (strain ATCC 38327) TaxID=578462 RepID=A0A0L0T1M1_ALLM3|nr:vacuole protein [Allomyces macrogynus ATCC 38327]|eukprot:KNE68520.1 vacuole protein [Allomyces macrogynus ATCC 38327]
MGGLCSTAKWKREEVPDHKFDFVDLDEYKRNDCWSMVGYSGVFLVTFRSVLVYLADLSTAVLIMAFDQWSTKPPDEIAKSANLSKTLGMSPSTYQTLANNLRWVYSGSIIVSFLLLALDTKKSFRIIKSRDISFAFTDTIAYRYYCLRSFAHWCFFQEVRSNHRTSDQIAQFVFFRLKGWKRLIFAETPRHIITAMLLAYQLRMLGLPDDTDLRKWGNAHPSATKLQREQYRTDFKWDLVKTHVLDVNSLAQQFGVFTMTFVFVMYVFNVLSTLVAAIVYVPLLCKIRGNLKEYVCHLIDKRIGELMRRKARKRIEQQQQELALYGTTKETAETGGPRAELPVLADDTASPRPRPPHRRP